MLVICLRYETAMGTNYGSMKFYDGQDRQESCCCFVVIVYVVCVCQHVHSYGNKDALRS